jgi:hypothetical protein
MEPITDADIDMAWPDVELALARCQQHKAFPAPSHIGDSAELRLLVVQLPTAQQRAYRLCDEDIASA